MNCKPGDLAVTHSMQFESNNGRLVSVLRIAGPHEHTGVGGLIGWHCLSLGSPMRNSSYGIETAPSMERPIADVCLRPIRDPGEDARDETLQWLPVPSQRKEVA